MDMEGLGISDIIEDEEIEVMGTGGTEEETEEECRLHRAQLHPQSGNHIPHGRQSDNDYLRKGQERI